MIKFANANIVQAFNAKAVGTRVLDPMEFHGFLLDAVKSFDFDAQTTPGQGFIPLPDDALPCVSAGVGRHVDDADAYVLRSWRGKVGAYLKREHAAPAEGLAAVVYTVDAYLADPDVAGDAAEVERIKAESPTHVIVAVLAFAGPKAPLTPGRFIHNLAGGNKDALAWDADTIRAKAQEIAAYSAEWGVVAD
jgi:hypothetical protein